MAAVYDTACNPIRGQNDSGKVSVASVLEAAGLAAAGYNAYKAYDIAYAEYKLAKKYYQLAKNWLDYYRDYYAPVEDQEIREATNIPVTTADYETARGRARVAAAMQFKGRLSKAMKCTSRYCTGLRQDMILESVTAQADALAMADGLGYRNERAYVEGRNDVRFEKMMNTAKRGRDMVADNVSLARATSGIYGELADQAWKGLQSAGMYLGYTSARHAPNYPTTYTSPHTNRAPVDAVAEALEDARGQVAVRNALSDIRGMVSQ